MIPSDIPPMPRLEVFRRPLARIYKHLVLQWNVWHVRNCTPLDHPFAFDLTTDCIWFDQHAL